MSNSDADYLKFYDACITGDLATVESLLKAGTIDINAEGNSALISASGHGKLEVVQLLLATGKITLDAPLAYECLAGPVEWGHTETSSFIMRKIKALGLTIDPKLLSKLLTYSAGGGDLETTKRLLDFPGVKITEEALKFAEQYGHTKIARVLLRHWQKSLVS